MYGSINDFLLNKGFKFENDLQVSIPYKKTLIINLFGLICMLS